VEGVLRAAALLPVLLLAVPAAAQDLAGLWQVEGSLPEGRTYRAAAALAADPDQPGRYRMLALGRLGGKKLTWRATGTLEGGVLEVRHLKGSGLLDALTRKSKQTLVGRYKLSGADRMTGRFSVAGTVNGGTARFRRAPEPAVALIPERLTLRAGQTADLLLRCEPRYALPLLAVDGPDVAKVDPTDGGRVVRLEPEGPGRRAVGVRVGPTGGKVVATCPLEVLPSLVDVVVRQIGRVKGGGTTAYVLIDLEGPLLDPRHRTRELLARVGRRHKDARLEGLSVEGVRPRVEETLAAAGLSPQEIAGPLGQEAIRAWREGYLQKSSLRHDRAVPKAKAALAKFASAGAKLIYMTDRPAELAAVSRDALLEAGFPSAELKAREGAGSAAQSKARVAQALGAKGQVVLVVDDDGAALNALRPICPDALVARFRTFLSTGDGSNLAPGVETITRWR
jgi:phosphoglycolate phosphatase-like HAD superfamily hydrolase